MKSTITGEKRKIESQEIEERIAEGAIPSEEIASSEEGKEEKKTKRRPNRDHVRRKNSPSPSNERIEEQIASLIAPAVYAQIANYQAMGLRARILTLPVMVGCVLSLLWRNIPSVRELVRCLASQDYFRGVRGLLGDRLIKVSAQALTKRFLEMPCVLFENVYQDLLPVLRERVKRRSRPVPKVLVEARKQFSRVLAVDCSTLEALFRKMDALRDVPAGTLAGRICALVDVESRLPEAIEFKEDPKASDFSFLDWIVAHISAGMLLLFDRGFHDYGFYDTLTEKGCGWISRPKSNDVIETKKVLRCSNGVYESLILIGSRASQNGQAQYALRLVAVKVGKNTYRYLTNVQDPSVLSAEQVAELYAQRWSIEEVFGIIKRLMNLSYLWTGSANGICLQIWGTLLYYAVLVDLADEIAEQLQVPFLRISLEMVHRGLYHFTQAHAKGRATDPVSFFVQEHKLYAILKQIDRRQRLPEFASPAPF